MEDFLKKYEKNITRKHSIAFTPKYEEQFRTDVVDIVCIALAEKTFEKLGWEVVYKDDNCIEAKRKEQILLNDRWTEAIIVNYKHGNVFVKSQSLGNEMWDFGKNSKRVKLFIYAYQEILKSFDRESLKQLEKEVVRKNSWDDYIVPETLPKPVKPKDPTFFPIIVGGLIISLMLGFVIALVSLEGLYFIGLFEFLVAIVIAFIMKYLIKLSNYTDFNKLQYFLATMVLIIYVSDQYFQYEIILHKNNFDRIGFVNFWNIRFTQGFTINKINLGWFGWIISWILQLGLTALILYLRMVSVLTNYIIERVPVEVTDFVFYLLVKEKSEYEIREELSKKGWIDVKNQNEVFEAVGGFQTALELNRTT